MQYGIDTMKSLASIAKVLKHEGYLYLNILLFLKHDVKYVTGFHPMWNETFGFDISVPELALVSFNVYDKDKYGKSNFIGYYAVPFHCMRKG